jgi:hypothetical protein
MHVRLSNGGSRDDATPLRHNPTDQWNGWCGMYTDNWVYSTTWRLPKDYVCPGGCVLQWCVPALSRHAALNRHALAAPPHAQRAMPTRLPTARPPSARYWMTGHSCWPPCDKADPTYPRCQPYTQSYPNCDKPGAPYPEGKQRRCCLL